MEFQLALEIRKLSFEKLLNLSHISTAAPEIKRRREGTGTRVFGKLVGIQKYARHKQVSLLRQKLVGGQRLLQHFSHKLAGGAGGRLNVAYKRRMLEIRGFSVVVDYHKS